MAMLAEPKIKRKWSLNPRGKLWSNDETKIGQKLLEKMGWAKGKGLGRDEQGDLEPIRLKYKNDAEGVGYESKDDQWVAHREEFNNILGALNGNHATVDETEPIPIKSLEVRSKSSKARVHYHKFTRGKDLSRYSASDMACILGKRANVETKKEDGMDTKESTESSNGSVQHLHGVTTIQRGSIQEYFASKMASAKEKQFQYLANDNDERNLSLNDSTNGERRVRINEDLNIVKEFCSKEKILNNEMVVVDETTEETRIKKKKKKSKKLEEESIDVPTEPLLITEEVLDTLETKKKKKKKKEKEQLEEVIPEPVIEAEPVKIKKSKKRKIEETISQPEIIETGEEDAHTQPKKKKKKSKKQEEPEAVEEAVEVIEPKAKKSKKNKTLEVAIEVVQHEEEPPTKKKKKKSKKNEEEAPTEKYTKMENSLIENAQTAGEMIENGVDSEQPPKKKKKKNKRGEEEAPETFRKIEEIEFESKSVEKFKSETTDEVVSIQNEVDVRVSKKNKKNKKSVEETLGTSVQEDKTSQDAQVNSTKEKSKKRRASDATDKVAMVDVKEKGSVQSTEETSKDKKNIDKKVCSADQLTCEADAKPDDSQQELDESRIKDLSTISTKGIIETESGGDLNILDNIQLSNGCRLSQKVSRKLMRAKFDQFVGSNLLSIMGYGVSKHGDGLRFT